MKFEELKDTLVAIYSNSNTKNLVVHIKSSPGIGKSSLAFQVFQTLQATKLLDGFYDMRGSDLESCDLRGIGFPDKESGKTTWLPPSFLPKKGERIMFFIDELPQSPIPVLNCLSQLLLDKKIGEYEFPEGSIILTAGNLDSDFAATNKIPSHIRGRILQFTLEADTEEFISFGEKTNRISPEILAYLKLKPTMLHQFDPRKSESGYPSPRSFEFLSKFFFANIINPSNEYEICSSCLGEAGGRDVVSFLRIYRSIPKIGDIINSPDSVPVPQEISTITCICVALAHIAKEENIDNLFRYILRLPPEFQSLFIVSIKNRSQELLETPRIASWMIKNQKNF